MKLIRAIGAILFGYVAMVLLITLVQEVWLGGVSWNGSSLPVLFVAGLFTFFSAVIAGLLAYFISGGLRISTIIMSLIVVLETIVLLATGRIAGPVWFDFSGSMSLVVGLFVGFAIGRSLTNIKSNHEVGWG